MPHVMIYKHLYWRHIYQSMQLSTQMMLAAVALLNDAMLSNQVPLQATQIVCEQSRALTVTAAPQADDR